MSNLLVEPPPTNQPKWRPYRGKPFTRVKRRTSLEAEYPTRRLGFRTDVQASTSSGKLRTQSEKDIYNLLIDNGYEPQIEPWALKILRNGSANGQEGWFVPDFYVNGDEDDKGQNGTFIEISMGQDLTNKLHKIRFVAEKYGKMVIHVTRDNISGFLADPDSLIDLIAQARIEELDIMVLEDEEPEAIDIIAMHARLGTKLEPRVKIEKARKPKKGRRTDPHKIAKPSNRPSRDLERRAERRALRKKAREMGKSVAEIRQNRRPISPRLACMAGERAPIKTSPAKSSAGPKPPSVRRINNGPLQKPVRRNIAEAA